MDVLYFLSSKGDLSNQMQLSGGLLLVPVEPGTTPYILHSRTATNPSFVQDVLRVVQCIIVYTNHRAHNFEPLEAAVREWSADKITVAEAMKRLKVKPNTFYKRVKEWVIAPILYVNLSNSIRNLSFISSKSFVVGLVSWLYIISLGNHHTGPLPLFPQFPISPLTLGKRCQ